MSGSKALFQRYWRVIAADDNERLEFSNAIRFHVTRTADTQPGKLELELINLNAAHRAFVERKGVNIELIAGYADYFGLIFKGAVEFGTSEHQKPNWITTLTVLDGAIQWRSVVINKAFKAGTDQKLVIEDLVRELTGLPQNIQNEFQAINQGLKGELDIVPVQLFPQVKQESKKGNKRSKIPPPLPEQIKKRQQQLDSQRAKAGAVKTERGRLARAAAFKKLDILCNSFGLTAIWDLQTLHIIPTNLILSLEAPVIAPGAGLIGSPVRISAAAKEGLGQRLNAGWEARCELHHELHPGALVYLASTQFEGSLLMSRVEFKGGSHDGGEWINIIQGEPYEA